MARLWQNVILSNFKDIFEYLPIETRIKEYQKDYYQAIANCHKQGNSNEFIEFMLNMINQVLKDAITTTSNNISPTDIFITKLLEVMEYNTPMTATQIMEKLNIKSKETFRNNYLDPAINKGLVQATIPDKPTSKNQMYYKKY